MAESSAFTGCNTTGAGGREADSPMATLTDLVKQHHAALYRYAYRLTGSQADAEDLTQHTFLVAQQRLSQLRNEEKSLPWLYAVLRNAFLKSCQRNNRAAVEPCNLDEVAEREAAASEIDQERLQQALAELPEEYRVALLMFYFEERSYKEIAAELNVPLGTVMSRLSRAKAVLREELTPREARGPRRAAAKKLGIAQ